MLVYPDIDPVAFYAFGYPVRWYGLMYLFALGLAVVCGRRALARRAMFVDAREVQIMDFVTAAALGVIIGGRLGYAVFYKLGDYLADPLSVLYLWQGGMSFHGGLVGAIVAVAVYARRAGVPFLRLADLTVLLAPPGLGLGRIGNFIGGELPGRVASADLPWAMIYGHIDDLPRHPSQLYQAFLEGVVLTALMVLLSQRWRPAGWLSAMFLIGYGVLRFFSEFFREPDAHLGLQLFDLSRGQWLCLPMVVAGGLMLWLLPGDKKKGRWKAGGKKVRVLGFVKPLVNVGRWIGGLPGRVLARRNVEVANPPATSAPLTVASPAMTSAPTMAATMDAAGDVAVAKPSLAAFVFAVGGYVVALPVRLWGYMNHKDLQVAGVSGAEYPDHNYDGDSEGGDGEGEGGGGDKGGALWRFFFEGSEPPRADIAEPAEGEYDDGEDDGYDDGDDGGYEDDDWEEERKPARKVWRVSDEADWDDYDPAGVNAAGDGDAEEGYGDGDDGDDRGGRRRGGLFGFFFGDDGDDDDGDDRGRPSRREKRRMKKKKRR